MVVDQLSSWCGYHFCKGHMRLTLANFVSLAMTSDYWAQMSILSDPCPDPSI